MKDIPAWSHTRKIDLETKFCPQKIEFLGYHVAKKLSITPGKTNPISPQIRFVAPGVTSDSKPLLLPRNLCEKIN